MNKNKTEPRMTPEQHLERIERSRGEVERLGWAGTQTKLRHRQVIRDAYSAGLSLRQLAEASGYSHETIRTIVREEGRTDA